MWAMMPMFLYFSSGVCRGMFVSFREIVISGLRRHHLPFCEESAVDGAFRRSGAGGNRRGPNAPRDPGRLSPAFVTTALPAVVREGLVGLRHLVRVFALLDRAALVARRRHQLVRELLRERVVRTGARERDDPARRERVPAVRTDFHRHLVVR